MVIVRRGRRYVLSAGTAAAALLLSACATGAGPREHMLGPLPRHRIDPIPTTATQAMAGSAPYVFAPQAAPAQSGTGAGPTFTLPPATQPHQVDPRWATPAAPAYGTGAVAPQGADCAVPPLDFAGGDQPMIDGVMPVSLQVQSAALAPGADCAIPPLDGSPDGLFVPVRTAPEAVAAGPVAVGPALPASMPRGTRSGGSARPGAWYVGVGASALPNLGAAVHVGRVISAQGGSHWAIEGEGIYQFFDDESLVDDGNPEAGDWYQLKLGLKHAQNIGPARRATMRAGVTWLRATGNPNIIQSPADYYGIYGGVGFESDLNRNWSMGPEVALALVTDNGDIAHGLVPQLTWRLTYWPGGTPGACCADHRPGEVYLGAVGLVSPGLGGAVVLGQVFHDTQQASWAFEMMAGAQSLKAGEIFADSDGDFGQVLGSLKATFAPAARSHWTARVGGTWMRNTGDVEFITGQGDRIGLHAGLGYAFDFGERIRTGPELLAHVVTPEGNFSLDVVPQFGWGLYLLF